MGGVVGNVRWAMSGGGGNIKRVGIELRIADHKNGVTADGLGKWGNDIPWRKLNNNVFSDHAE